MFTLRADGTLERRNLTKSVTGALVEMVFGSVIRGYWSLDKATNTLVLQVGGKEYEHRIVEQTEGVMRTKHAIYGNVFKWTKLTTEA